MNTERVFLYGRRLVGKAFGGVYAFDRLARLCCGLPPFHRGAYVYNTDPSSLPGEHWVAVWFDGRGSVFFMDTFGRAVPSALARALTDFRIFRSVSRLQGVTTVVCGHYCLYWLRKVARGVPPSSVVADLLSFSNALRRDHWVARTVSRWAGARVGPVHYGGLARLFHP